MQLITKNLKKIILSVCVLVMMMSVTVFAENDKIENREAASALEGYEVVLDFTNSGNVYTGNPIEPEVSVVKKDENDNIVATLNPETDYTVAFDNNVNASEEASVVVTGKDAYAESVITKNFAIAQASLSEAEVTLAYESTVYDGSEQKPEVTKVTLYGVELSTENYDVTYSDNKNAGNALVTIQGKGNYTDSVTKTFVIEKASLSNAKVKLAYTTTIYTGSAKKPKVKSVTFGENGNAVATSNYTVAYAKNTNAGKATVTIKAKGNNYKGKKVVTFTIKPKKLDVSLTTSYEKVKISWDKVSKADGYMIYRKAPGESKYKKFATVKSVNTLSYTTSKVEHNKKYYYIVKAYKKVNGNTAFNAESSAKNIKVRVAKAQIKKITRVSPVSLKITWDKVKGATGYRVYRSTSKNGEYETVATVKGNGTVSYVDSKVECGKTYYYKMKAFREVSKVKYAGEYSNVKSQYTRPRKAQFTSASYYKGTKAVLEWRKVSYADGYVIYRATKENGTYKAVETIKDANTLKWTDTGLSKTKAYYYKIKAYCDVDGKKVYSVYSNYFKKATAEWRYSTFQGQKIKYYYNADNELVTDVSNVIGKQSSYVIKVNKQRATVTVYAKDGKNGYIIPVKAMRCSPGWNTPEGTFYTPKKYRWKELMGPCWGQWSTRISGSFLFHSVFYNSYHNSDTLSVNGYNKLGTVCSHGCVRLTAGDAKWIYDNCKLGTKVIIYNSSVSGPLGKPSTYKLPYWHTWDPTDPNKFAKCDAYGCH